MHIYMSTDAVSKFHLGRFLEASTLAWAMSAPVKADALNFSPQHKPRSQIYILCSQATLMCFPVFQFLSAPRFQLDITMPFGCKTMWPENQVMSMWWLPAVSNHTDPFYYVAPATCCLGQIPVSCRWPLFLCISPVTWAGLRMQMGQKHPNTQGTCRLVFSHLSTCRCSQRFPLPIFHHFLREYL